MPSSDLLKYNNTNHLLLASNSVLTECCCGDDVFWEAVPCDAFLVPTDYCFNVSGCVFPRRKYVAQSVFCEGNTSRVCECNTFDAYQLQDVIPGGATNVASIALNVGWSVSSGVIYNDRIELSARNDGNSTRYNFTFPYSTYTTVGLLSDAINNSQGNSSFPFTYSNNRLPSFDSPEILKPTNTGFGIISGGTQLASVSSFLKFSWNGLETNKVEFPATYDNNNIAIRIQNRLQQLNGLSEISVDWSRFNNDDSLGLKHFYFTFNGSLCGSEQSPIVISKIGIVSDNLGFSSNNFKIVTANYEYGWAAQNDNQTNRSRNYIRIPSGTYGIVCPYEDPSNFSINGEFGFAAYSPDIQCCPQKGTLLGPNQNLPTRSTYGNTQTGSEYTFPYLENTVILNEECHKIDPFFFLFGEEGRFDDNPQKVYYQTFTRPNCVIPSGCDQSVPYNCVEQLFYPGFHPNCPWGVFGAYYRNIEIAGHPNVNTILAARIGADYAPNGTIRTYGTWQETRYIYVDFFLYKRLPFYVGLEDIDDRVNAGVTGICADLSINGNGTSLINLTFDCSGKTIGDFLDCVNAITTIPDTSGYEGSCPVFNFCAASEEARSVPASKINNLTSELFDVWKEYFGLSSNPQVPAPFGISYPGLSYPDTDEYLWSGSDIYPAPKNYNDTQLVSPNKFNNSSVNDPFAQPPPCRYKPELPKDPISFNMQSRQTSSFWQAMMGANQSVLTIRRNPGGLDTELTNLTVLATGRTVGIHGYSGSTIVRSGIFPTNFNGSGYTATDLQSAINGLTWTRLTGGSSYNPVISSTGQPFSIWLDDHSWWDSVSFEPREPFAAGAVKTPLNWSYHEPLLTLDQTSIVDINTSIDLKSWIRRRCGWYQGTYDANNLNETQPRFCLPGDAPLFGEGTINCDGDLQIDGNWLVAYGCLGESCKTEYFIKAERCGCSTIENCGEGGSVEVENTLVTDASLAPTLYICEQNLRRDCTIPFMIKVPLQSICYSGIDACFDEIFPFLSQSCQDYLQDNVPDYEQSLTCLGGVVPASYMTFDKFGWCQYIDPTTAERVKKSEIPRAYPAVAYVWERSSTPVCETEWRAAEFIDLDQPGCNYTKYAGIKPWTIYELVEDNTACFDPGNLFAHIRAAVTNLEYGTCDRDDIDCSLRCCGCYFTCQEEGGIACQSDGPYKFCTNTTTQAMTDTVENNIDVCVITYINAGDPFPVCSVGGYGPNGGNPFEVSSCFGGFYDTTITTNYIRTNSFLCGCQSTLGTSTQERTAPAMDCSDCNGCSAAGGCNCPAECGGGICIACAVQYGSVDCGTILSDFGYDNTCCMSPCLGFTPFNSSNNCINSSGNSIDTACRTDTRNVCGYGTITNSRTVVENVDVFAGLGCGQCAVLPPSHTRTRTINSVITITNPSCQGCGFSIPNIKNQAFIEAYRPSGYCDYPNQLTLSTTGIYH